MRPRGRAAARGGVAALALAALLTACTSTTAGRGTTDLGAESTSGGFPASTGAPTPTAPRSSTPGRAAGDCNTYAAPDPNRPSMTLHFTIADDHRTVKGTERVVFHPDRPVDELVFRLTANTRPTVAEGNRIEVTSATAQPAGGAFRFSAANADPGTQGGLLHLPLGSRVPAGGTATAELAFTLTLGQDSFDRFGTAGDFAYFGSAEPLLAWERGFGWHDEGLIEFPAESATSEAMNVDLTVVAPARDTVIMSGDPADPPKSGATRTWHSTIAAARDVSVAAGPFSVRDVTVEGVKLRLGAPDAGVRDALVPEFARAIKELARHFGPFPFPSLSVARLPASGGGIEYPSSILMLDGSRLVAVHETAHQWFYAMVGDSQALHPWLDEAFAQYAEELVNGTQQRDADAVNAPGNVDASTESYGSDMDRYYFTTYDKGAGALAAAREAAGPAKWDAALRCYVAHNAWRIANPSDLKSALSHLPAAVSVLEKAGALR